MIWSSTSTGEITYASPEWTIFTGQPTSEALGEGWLNYLHPEDVDRTKTSFFEALSLHAAFTFAYRLKHIRLGFIPVIVAATPSFSPIDKKFIGYIGALTEASAVSDESLHRNIVGVQAFIPPGSLTAPSKPIDIIADYLLLARATAVKASEERMLPSLDFAISEVMREIGSTFHDTLQ